MPQPQPPVESTLLPWPAAVPVLIAGGGPVGLTLAALLGRHGIPSLVIEADDGYCSGSRAICISRRSQEILGWAGAAEAVVAKGLPWAGGRSYFRDTEVLHFRMQSEATERFAPMLNLQQFYVEEFVHRSALAGQALPGLVDVRWASRVVAVRQSASGAEVDVQDAEGLRHTVRADWLVACDGGRSTVREALGLKFDGVQYEGRYVIVDIEQTTQRSVERLAWFDPPSNPGSTLLMHRQPDNVWRIDYQVRDDEDPAEAVKPENVLPRVHSHLQMIGETAPWKPLWISIYNAKCLTLDAYRHGRVLFAGDAAHLVPIFGVRGLNSGLDDAGNLAWKLALVIQGQAKESLLDSYSEERVHATRQNLAYGAKSTEFMAPPHAGFKLMRDAALRLATEFEPVRSLINPRQSTPISYPTSPLNASCDTQRTPCPGEPAPDAKVRGSHLSQHFGHGFVALWFCDEPAASPSLLALGAERDAGGLASPATLTTLTLLRITRQASAEPDTLFDEHSQAWQRYRAREGDVFLVRPDAYLLAAWAKPQADALRTALRPFLQRRPEAEKRL